MSEDSHSRRPANSAFKQQALPAWQPILTPWTVIPTFFGVGVVFIPIGVILYLASQGVIEASVNYTDCDPLSADAVNGSLVCSRTIVIEKDMKAPVYAYYELDNYYQNHRRYVKSRSDAQLRGEGPFTYQELSDCDPRIGEGDKPDENQIYVPCGLIAWSWFNDTFVLVNPDNTEITMSPDGIAWKSDVEQKFGVPEYDTGIHVIPPEDFKNERFIVWMRTAGLPHFRKLWGIINEDVPAGTYTIGIDSRFPVTQFDGSKAFVLSTTSWAGGKNDFLGLAYIIVGCICFLLGAIFAVANCVKPRKLGDQSFLVWQHTN